VRLLLALLFAASLTLTARADDEPAPEPKEGEAPKGDAEPKQEDKAFDEEADYLALADAPVFLPRSYLYWGTPVGPKYAREDLTFALEYALHLSIYSNIRDQALTGKNWAGAVTLTFEGDLRMINGESKPVRMPSYRPNLNGQVFYIWHRPQPILAGLRVAIEHYSNGQEQCAFDRAQPDESPACKATTDAVTDPARQLNRINGNFATNGWIVELNGRIHQTNSKGVAIGHLAAGVGVFGMVQNGSLALEPYMRRLYGWGRLSANLEAKKRMGWATMTVRVSGAFYPRTDGSTPNKSGIVEAVIGPYWLTGLGFFARYYGGRDFYNAFFVDNIQQFSAGLAWDGERPFKFKRDN
jgi:outer membrane phospholipase A